jgi:hypothetical protein
MIQAVQMNSYSNRDSSGAESLMREIQDYCRQYSIAESTFGRLAVNDGKLVSRLRYGGRITRETADRVRKYMNEPPVKAVWATSRSSRSRAVSVNSTGTETNVVAGWFAQQHHLSAGPSAEQKFRFYDNRQKYLMFVNTCSEKRVVAERVTQELANIRPRPPALRMFDAGVGDGTVLARVMRAMHQRFETLPFYIVGKEISLEDVRLALEKMPDRFHEHAATVVVLTNLNYSEAPLLMPNSVENSMRLIWREAPLRGSTAAEFERDINELEPFLAQYWRTSVSKKTGNPVYEQPVVLVLYLEKYKFLLNQVLPKRGNITADYDLILASQPYRARASSFFKASKVIAPLVKGLAPGGRLIGVHSCGDDPGMEIIRAVWPDEAPFFVARHDILQDTKTVLGSQARHFNFNALPDERSKFRYQMYTLPNEIGADAVAIGTSTLVAAWNNATYVAQIEDARLTEVMASGRYLDATRQILRKHNGLWFNDESYIISRKRDS